MRWINGETWETTKRRLCNWHRWFAWYPVRVGVENGHWVKVWLEYVERKGEYFEGWYFSEYREIKKEE